MLRAKLPFIAAAVIFLCLPYRAFAGDDWQPINPEELKMTADPHTLGTRSCSTTKKLPTT